jgi:hypothetical protein
MAIRFQSGSDRVDGLNVVKIGKRIRWYALGFGQGFILDVCQDSNFPIALKTTTGGLIFSARKHFLSLDEVNFVASIRYKGALARFACLKVFQKLHESPTSGCDPALNLYQEGQTLVSTLVLKNLRPPESSLKPQIPPKKLAPYAVTRQ